VDISGLRLIFSGLVLVLVAADPGVAAATTISSFTPTSGTIGTQVVVNGTGFTGATVVSFHGAAAAKYSVVSDIKITVIVPVSASTGAIAVTSPGGNGTSASSFTMLPGMALQFASGHPFVTTTVYGAGFHPSTAGDLYFDTTDEALFVASSTGTLAGTLRIPVSAQPGLHWITYVERGSNLAAQRAFTVRTEWVKEGFNAFGRGVNPFENTLDTGNASTLTLSWSGDAGGFSNVSPFIVAGSGANVFLGDVLGAIRAYSNTGNLLWTAAVGNDLQRVYPTAFQGNVFFGDSAGNVRGFSQTCRSDGGICTPLWTTNVATQVTAGLAMYKGTLYVPTSDGSVHTLNPATGVQGTPVYGLDTTHGPVTTPLAFDVDGSYYYGAGTYVEYHLTRGVSGVSSFGGTVSPIAVSNGTAYATTSDGLLHKLTYPSWDVTASSAGCSSAPLIVSNMVFAGGCSAIGGYNLTTGALRWNISTESIIGLSEANGVLYACEEHGNIGNIQAYDLVYGSSLWTGGWCNTAPEIANGNVFAALAQLSAYSLSTLAGAPRRAPAIAALRPDYRLKPRHSDFASLPSAE
jgi:hypothetical protein